MFSITLICMGKLKEKFYIQAAEEYKKRLGAFCDFQLLELPEARLPENPNASQIAQGLSKEAEAIRAKLPKGSAFWPPRERVCFQKSWPGSCLSSKKAAAPARAFSSARRSAWTRDSKSRQIFFSP